jgi:hypothetical protein
VGGLLEARRPGAWLADTAAAVGRPIALDAVRTPVQASAARDRLPNCVLVYLTARKDVRQRRFERSAYGTAPDAAALFAQLATTPLELTAESLAVLADLAIDTVAHDAGEVLGIVLEELRNVADSTR